MSVKIYRLLLVVFLAWSICSTTLTVYYYTEYLRLLSLVKRFPVNTIAVNIGIDYGNGTVVWFNNTLLPLKSSVFSALLSIANVKYRFGTYGVYIVSINDVKEKIISNREGFSWVWYLYNSTTGKLILGPVAADKYYLNEGDIIVWKYIHWKF